jgi:hypothetical protein
MSLASLLSLGSLNPPKVYLSQLRILKRPVPLSHGIVSAITRKEPEMQRLVLRFLLAQVFLASFAMADPGSMATPSLKATNPLCDNVLSDLWAGNPMDGAVFLSPPQGCTSICSAAQGKSCSPANSVKSCFDVNQPDGCQACICTASLVWDCGL